MGEPAPPPPPPIYESPSVRRRAQREIERVTRRGGREGSRGIRPGYEAREPSGGPLKAKSKEDLDRHTPDSTNRSVVAGLEGRFVLAGASGMASQGKKQKAGAGLTRGIERGDVVGMVKNRHGGASSGSL
jgi:hypothetical protein